MILKDEQIETQAFLSEQVIDKLRNRFVTRFLLRN